MKSNKLDFSDSEKKNDLRSYSKKEKRERERENI